MRIFVWLFLLFLALAPIIVGCRSAGVPQRSPASASAAAGLNLARRALPANPCVGQALGINIHFTDSRPGEMRMIAAAGFRWVRMDLFWAATEKKADVYDFSSYDRLITELRRYRMRAMLILDYGNPLYASHILQDAPVTRSARRAFVRWAAAAVRHFRNRRILWEMWSEPNNNWPSNALPAYVKLASEVGKTIRHITPRQFFVGPGEWIDIEYHPSILRDCFRGGLLRYWDDGVAVHPYRATDPEAVIPRYRRLRQLLARCWPHGDEIPIISSEWGYSSWGEGFYKTWNGDNDTAQARMLAREFLINLSQGIPLSIWYDWHDDGTNPKNPEDNFGIVKYKYHPGRKLVYEPKPAYLAAKTLLTQLRGCRFVKRLGVGGPNDYVLLFAGSHASAPRGTRPVIAAWTTFGWTGSPEALARGSRAALHSPRIPKPTTRHVTLAVPSGTYVVTNETGTEMRMVEARDDKLVLSISHDPEYLARR